MVKLSDAETPGHRIVEIGVGDQLLGRIGEIAEARCRAVEVTVADGVAACRLKLLKVVEPRYCCDLGQAGLEAGVEAGKLAAGGGGALRHLAPARTAC